MRILSLCADVHAMAVRCLCQHLGFILLTCALPASLTWLRNKLCIQCAYLQLQACIALGLISWLR